MHQTFFKEPKSGKVERRQRRNARTTKEQQVMAAVRKRDKRCRFPLCGCKKFGLQAEVSHFRHRGMGGNPEGDRTVPRLLVLVCSARHRENKFSIDRGTVRWEPVSAHRGADGPIDWWVSSADLPEHLSRWVGPRPGEWICVAAEWQAGNLTAPSPGQLEILNWLAKMDS